MGEPVFQSKRKQGVAPRWTKDTYKSTRQYKFLGDKRYRAANDTNGGVAGAHMGSSGGSKKRKTKKRKIRNAKTKKLLDYLLE